MTALVDSVARRLTFWSFHVGTEICVCPWLIEWRLLFCWKSWLCIMPTSCPTAWPLGHFELSLNFILTKRILFFSFGVIYRCILICFLCGQLPIFWIIFYGFLQTALKGVTKNWDYFYPQILEPKAFYFYLFNCCTKCWKSWTVYKVFPLGVLACSSFTGLEVCLVH